MLFTIITIAIWLLFAFLLHKCKKDQFTFAAALLPLLIFSVLVTIDLGVNYIASAVPALNDGIGIHGLLSGLIFGEDGWSVDLFRRYYHGSMIASSGLLLVYMAALFIPTPRKKTATNILL